MDWKELWYDIADVMTDVTNKAEEKKDSLKEIDINSIKGVAGDIHQRLSLGYHEISREEHLRVLMPLLNEVKMAARKLDPDIPADIKVYIRYEENNKTRNKNKKDPEDVVALRPDALGLSENFFKLPAGSQKAVLGIGFGKMLYFLNAKVFRDEFVSDEFCFNLGYGDELCEYLDTLKGKQKNIDARIGKLQELGSGYKKEQENANGKEQTPEPEEPINKKYVFNIRMPGQGKELNTEPQPEQAPDGKGPDITCDTDHAAVSREDLSEGKDKVTICSVCHKKIIGEARFCYNCGNRLSQD